MLHFLFKIVTTKMQIAYQIEKIKGILFVNELKRAFNICIKQKM